MRFIIFLLALVSGATTYFFYDGDKQQKPYLLGVVPIYIQNIGPKAIPLYSAKKPSIIIKNLEPLEVITFESAGLTGKWFYGHTEKYDVILKDTNRQKIVFIQDKAFSLITLRDYSAITSATLFLVLIFTSIIKRIGRLNAEKEIQKRQAQKEANESHERNQLRQAVADLQRKNHELAKSAQEISNYRAKESALMAQERKMLEVEFKKQQALLDKKILEETEKRTNVKVVEMQESYDKINSAYEALKELHEKCKDDCLSFDINFASDGYENLLKGRKFEIYFAKNLLANQNFEILEWTSDKGTENGIKVKANGNPDFVIAYHEPKSKPLKFSVECKYRKNNYFKSQYPESLSWATERQRDRYIKFGKDKKMPVYLALGCHSDPEQPAFTFLVGIEKLDKQSKRDKPKKDSEWELIIAKKHIANHLLHPDTFSNQAISIIQEAST